MSEKGLKRNDCIFLPNDRTVIEDGYRIDLFLYGMSPKGGEDAIFWFDGHVVDDQTFDAMLGDVSRLA